jgi:hypothetical protein
MSILGFSSRHAILGVSYDMIWYEDDSFMHDYVYNMFASNFGYFDGLEDHFFDEMLWGEAEKGWKSLRMALRWSSAGHCAIDQAPNVQLEYGINIED